MPKDKNSIKGFATDPADTTAMRKCHSNVDPIIEEEKAEPQDETEIMCYYWEPIPECKCPGPMGDECHYVIKNGNMVMAHKRCHQRDQNGEKKTPTVMIR